MDAALHEKLSMEILALTQRVADLERRKDHDLRDHFAAKVMMADQAAPESDFFPEGADITFEQWQAGILKRKADYYYKLADAMLLAREIKE